MNYGSVHASATPSLKAQRSKAPATRSFAKVAATLCATFAVAVLATESGRERTGSMLLSAGDHLAGIDARASDSSAEDAFADNFGCSCTNLCNAAVIDVSSLRDGSPTQAPTTVFDAWTCYFTDGHQSESYVMLMASSEAGVVASSLVDTGGYAMGIAVHPNETTAWYTDHEGSVWRVDNDGEGLLEIWTAAEHGNFMGIDYYHLEGMLYWVSKDGYLFKGLADGTGSSSSISLDNDYECDTDDDDVSKSATMCYYDLKINELQGELYLSHKSEGVIITVDLDFWDEDANSTATTVFLEDLNSPRGLWLVPDEGYIYFTTKNAIYRADINDAMGTQTEILSTDSSANNEEFYSVAVDTPKEMIFFTTRNDDEGGRLAYTDLDGESTHLLVYVAELSMVYVVEWVSPTPAPTPAPTRTPTMVPTSFPTQKPTRKPSPVPTSAPSMNPVPAPTMLPIPAPTSLPIPAPTSVPTSEPTYVPTSVPTSAPTSVPTSVPTSLPTSVPIPAPTSLPIPAPTSLPIPAPTSLPIPAPTSVPTSVPTMVPTPAPSTVCEYYMEQCDYCAC